MDIILLHITFGCALHFPSHCVQMAKMTQLLITKWRPCSVISLKAVVALFLLSWVCLTKGWSLWVGV